MQINGLEPVLALIVWTCVVWFWLYLTRIPAMRAARIHPDKARHPGTYGADLPSNVRAVADNYNHLHEQPTLFYAITFYAVLTGGLTSVVGAMAWAYVALRIVHSLVQILSPRVIYRFAIFFLASLVLIAMVAMQVYLTLLRG